MAARTTAPAPTIVDLIEAAHVPPPPPDHDHREPMFGLSPEDKAIGEEQRAHTVADEMKAVQAAAQRKARRGRRPDTSHPHGDEQ